MKNLKKWQNHCKVQQTYRSLISTNTENNTENTMSTDRDKKISQELFKKSLGLTSIELPTDEPGISWTSEDSEYCWEKLLNHSDSTELGRAILDNPEGSPEREQALERLKEIMDEIVKKHLEDVQGS